MARPFRIEFPRCSLSRHLERVRAGLSNQTSCEEMGGCVWTFRGARSRSMSPGAVSWNQVGRQMYSVMVGNSPLGHRPALRCFREMLVETLSGLETAQSRELLLSGYGA